jgi:hypothetical protein
MLADIVEHGVTADLHSNDRVRAGPIVGQIQSRIASS